MFEKSSPPNPTSLSGSALYSQVIIKFELIHKASSTSNIYNRQINGDILIFIGQFLFWAWLTKINKYILLYSLVTTKFELIHKVLSRYKTYKIKIDRYQINGYGDLKIIDGYGDLKIIDNNRYQKICISNQHKRSIYYIGIF